VGSQELTANDRVSQTVEVVDPREKNGRLLDLLRKYHKGQENKVGAWLAIGWGLTAG
jgi:ATP-dependent RNA helicase DBP3